MSVEPESISFKNGSIDVAGALRSPEGSLFGGKRAALVIVQPGSSVKEQTAAVYGEKMAAEGFVTLTFDPSYQGESGGEPRDLENPAMRVEDIRCAVDFLTTLPEVDEERIGILGICAGGGYTINASLTEHRIKAVGTVVATNIGRAYRQSDGTADYLQKTLAAVGKQRTAEARGMETKVEPWIPDSPEQAQAAGLKDMDTLEAVDYYRTPRGFHKNSSNRKAFRSDGLILGFDAFHLVEDLLTQPLQVIVGDRLGTFGSFADGQQLFARATCEKDLLVIQGASHYDMYDKQPYVDQAVERLAGFYKKHLSG